MKKVNVVLKNIPENLAEIIFNEANNFYFEKRINPDALLNVTFVSKDEIQSLNKKYRHKNQPTDVLSFPIWKELSAIPKKGKVALGDIFICPEQTEVSKNLKMLARHSLNHLIGIHD